MNEINLSVSSRGTSLFSSAVNIKLTREEVEKYLIQGFFPLADENAKVNTSRQLGLQTMGLKYEVDPAITKHLVCFLRKARQNVCSNEQLRLLSEKSLELSDELLLPNKILFNGGVFKSEAIRNCVLESIDLLSSETLYSWQAPVTILPYQEGQHTTPSSNKRVKA